jgi:hypothetical protein
MSQNYSTAAKEETEKHNLSVMSLSSLLGPGDDISYRQSSSQSLSFGRIINRGNDTLTIHRYDSDVELDDNDLPEVFFNLQELVQTEDQVIISQGAME